MKSAVLLHLASIALATAIGVVEHAPLSSKMDTIPLNTVLDWIAQHFPFNILVKDAGDLIANAEGTLASVLGISTTKDTFVDDECTTVTILYARGTSEVGNVGIIVGPEFFDAVTARLHTGDTLAVRGVDYGASIDGFLEGGDTAGSEAM